MILSNRKLFFLCEIVDSRIPISFFPVAEKPLPPPKDVPMELMPESLVELETSCGDTASKAIAAYQKAACAIQDYNQDVIKVVESVNATVGSPVWNR